MKLFNNILKGSLHHQRGSKRHASVSAEKAPSTTTNGAPLASLEDEVDDESFASHQTYDTECLDLGVATKIWTYDKNKPPELSRQQRVSLDTYISPATPDLSDSFATHDTGDTASLNLGVATKTWTFDKSSLLTNTQKQQQQPQLQQQQRMSCSVGLSRSDSITRLNLPNTVGPCEAPSPIKKQKSLKSNPSIAHLWSRVQEKNSADASKGDSLWKESKVPLSKSCHVKRNSPPKTKQELSKMIHEHSPRRVATKSSPARPALSRQPYPFQKQASERFLTRHLEKQLSLADVFNQYDKIVDSISSLSTCLSDEDPAQSGQSSNDTTSSKPAAEKQTYALSDPKKPRGSTNFYASRSLLDQHRPSLEEHNSFQCKRLQDCLHEYDEITHQCQMKGW